MENGRLAIMAPAAHPPLHSKHEIALRFLLYFGHFCIMREHTALYSVLRTSTAISYLGLDRHFHRSIKGTELEVILLNNSRCGKQVTTESNSETAKWI